MTLRLLLPMLFEEPDKEMLTGFFRHGLHGIHGFTLFFVLSDNITFFYISMKSV